MATKVITNQKTTFDADDNPDVDCDFGAGPVGADTQRTTLASDDPAVVALQAANKASTATLSNVSSSASSVTLLSLNANRVGATIVNDSTQTLYVKFGTTASATSYTYKVSAGRTVEFPLPCFTGRVDGIWVSANGSARITEITT